MAPQQSQSHLRFTPLRVVTQRLASTTSQQLPHIVPLLAATVARCRESFSFPETDVESRNGSENALLVHKFKTQISSLLQDKTPEARYAAVVLIKAAVKAGGWNVLQGAGMWVRGLLSVLGVSKFNLEHPTKQIKSLLASLHTYRAHMYYHRATDGGNVTLAWC